MKTTLFLICFPVIFISFACAQTPGEWTWMNGESTMNYLGSFGIMGIASPNNKPPGTYASSQWTDNQGNFWFYGGQSAISINTQRISDDLWKYEFSTNQWTWMKGSGGLSDVKPVYGIKGIASPDNTPGERLQCQSWSDDFGNLWLFGGVSYGGGMNNDLWKYNIAINQWTWMKGDTIPLPFDGGHYGIKGIEDSLNNPPHQEVRDITWQENGNLWLLDYYGCLWKYRIATNNWIWVNGDTNGITCYGQKGVPSSNTTPGFNYYAYTRWQDSKNNFWYLFTGNDDGYKDLFKYNIETNMWTWVWGDSTKYDIDSYYGDSLCNYSHPINPFSRLEAGACWTDRCDNLWVMGGYGRTHSVTDYGDFNDLIYFDTHLLQWVWVDNDTTHNSVPVYGTMGVSSPLNKPPQRCGAIPFKDIHGNLWLYGGAISLQHVYFADLWRFALDSGCTPCLTPYNSGISENKDNNSVSIFPNPALYELTVEYNFKTENLFELYDIIGVEKKSEVLPNGSGTKKIDLTYFANGLYFYSISDRKGNRIKTGKLIVQK